MNNTIIQAVGILFKIMEYTILARVLLSWIPIGKDNAFIKILYQITEPILGHIRSIINKSAIGGNSMIDFSPIVAFLLIGFVRVIVIRILISVMGI